MSDSYSYSVTYDDYNEYDYVNKKYSYSYDSSESSMSDSNDYNKYMTQKVVTFTNDEITCTNTTSYWFYILSQKQWDTILNKFENDVLYMSMSIDIDNKAHTMIESGDVFYIWIRNTGIVGFVKIDDDPVDNSDNKIKIFRDKNMNRFVLSVETVVLLQIPIKLKNLDTIIKYYTKNNHSIFKRINLYGEYRMAYIDSNMGLQMLIHICTITQSDDYIDDSPEQIIPDTDNTDNAKVIEFINNKNVPEIYDMDNFVTVNNIPIMMVLCDDLICTLDKVETDKEKQLHIRYHYEKCDNCDITNNGKRTPSFNVCYYREYGDMDDNDDNDNDDYDDSDDSSDMSSEVDVYEEILDMYDETFCYNTECKTCDGTECTRIHRMCKHLEYDNCVLIEFTSILPK